MEDQLLPTDKETMDEILIPTDFSDNALNAALFAMDLFGPQDFEYTVLNCYDMPAYGDSGMLTIEEHMANASKEGLDAFMGDLNSRLTKKGYQIRSRSAHGQLDRVVHNYSHRSRIPALVVMGTQGASGVKEVFMGTNTADVIKHCHLPVLAVPEHARHSGSTRIVLADDGGGVAPKALSILADIVRRTGSELVVTRVVNEKATVKVGSGDELDLALEGLPFTTIELSGADVMKELNEEVARSKAGMLAVVHRDRGIFDGLFHRSIAARLSMHTHTPMLVVQQSGS